MKIKIISVLFLIVLLLLLVNCEALVILEEAGILEVPRVCVLALLAVMIAEGVIFFVFIKRPGVREVTDSSKLIQGLAIAGVVCAALVMLTGLVLSLI